MNRSTALRLLTELDKTDYVSRDPDTKCFSIVPSGLLSLAARPGPRRDWVQVVDQVLSRVRDETGDSTVLGVPSDQAMVYLVFHPTNHVLSVTETVGARRPMHCSALGKAYLSALPEEELHREVARMSFDGGTPRAASDASHLIERIEEAQKDGYALDLEETLDSIRCVAVPVRVQGSLVGAAGITGPSTRMTVARTRELGARLKRELAGL